MRKVCKTYRINGLQLKKHQGGSSIQASLRFCADSNGPELRLSPLLDSQFFFVLG